MDFVEEDEAAAPRSVASVRELLRKDLRLLLFYLAPLMEDFSDDNEWLVRTHRLPESEINRMRQELIRAGLWVRDSEGRIQTRHARLGLADDGSRNLTLSEFLSLISQIISHVTPADHCWAECHTVVTSNEVKNEFISDVTLALSKFLERSKQAAGQTTLSWTHISLDPLKAIQQENDR